MLPISIRKILRMALLASIWLASSAVNAAPHIIDVLVVHTKGVSDLYGGDPTTRFNQLFQFTNQIYSDSNLEIEIRLVKTHQVNYTDDNSSETALRDLTNGSSAFSKVAKLREQYKADMVIFYRPFREIHGNCGLAWIGGVGTNGDFSDASIKKYMFAHVAIDSCGDFVTAHELGHNMGLKHSREQDGQGGTFHFALGYGVMNAFTTIMAYQSTFNIDYWSGKVYKFSSPDLDCGQVKCGVARTDKKRGADARYTLSVTAPQIANFYAGTATPANGGVVDIEAVNQQVKTAKEKYDAAMQALSDNQQAIEKYQQQANDFKALVLSIKSKLEIAQANYLAAVKVANPNRPAVAKSRVRSLPMTESHKPMRSNKATLSQAAPSTSVALAKAKKTLAALTQSLRQATQKYELATQAVADEKARTLVLTAQVNQAAAAYNELLATQNALLNEARLVAKQ